MTCDGFPLCCRLCVWMCVRDEKKKQKNKKLGYLIDWDYLAL